jgi:hypothetical protein
MFLCNAGIGRIFTLMARDKHHTYVNLTLGSLCRLHYPSIVKVSDGDSVYEVLVSTWDEYKLKKERDHTDK